MRRCIYIVVCLLILSIPVFAHDNNGSELPALPLRFTENKGQWNKQVLFGLNSQTSSIYFQKEKLTFSFQKEEEEAEEHKETHKETYKNSLKRQSHEEYTTSSYSLLFLNSNASSKVIPQQKLTGYEHYLLGNDLGKHVKNVESYNSILYENIYKGIDFRFYEKDQDLKYDVILHKNTSINTIQLQYRGIQKISKTEQGDLEIITQEGTLTEKKPYSYQLINNQVKQVQVEYVVLNDSTYGFVAVESYDKNEDLIIDPVMLEWATYMGGYGRGYLYDLATDSAGYIYYTGYYSNTFPVTSGAYSTTYSDTTDTSLVANPYQGDVYVIKLTPDAKSIVYATYIGGNAWDYAFGLQINSNGETFITGATESTNFPFTSGTPYVPTSYIGGFVLRLNSSGNELVYSAPFAGNGYDIDINNQNEAFVTGQAGLGAFIFGISSGGDSFLYTNEITKGAGSDAIGKRVKIFNNQAYVVGYTSVMGSLGLLSPTSNALLPNPPLGYYDGGYDAFVYRVDSAGNVLYSSYLGGIQDDFADGIDINSKGELLVMGETWGDFPITPGARAFSFGLNYFLCKFSADLSSFVFSTYMGNAYIDDTESRYKIEGNGDARYTTDNSILFAGFNNLSDFPITSDALYKSNDYVTADIFISLLDSLGNKIIYATYYGGNNNDYYGPSIAFTKNEHCMQEIVLGFTTHSTDLPTKNAAQPTKLNSDYDQPFLLKLNFDYSILNSNKDTAVCGTTPLKLVAPMGTNYTYLWSTGDTTSTILAPLTAPYWLKVSNGVCNTSDTINAVHVSPPSLNWPIDTIVCTSSQIQLNAENPSSSYVWSTGDTIPQVTVNQSGTYSIQIHKTPCILKDTINVLFDLNPPLVNLGNNAVVCDPQNIKLDAGNIGSGYQWSTGDTTRIISVGNDSIYWVQVTDHCGRTVSDTIKITKSRVFTPNIFTPNNDGYNDTYSIIYNGEEDYSLQIYNQWGAQVFKTTNKNEVWTGDNIPDGIYYYYTQICGKEYKGWVQLIR